MAGISGQQLDQLLYPNTMAPDQRMAGRYGKRAGAAAGQGGGRSLGESNFRDQTWLQREQGQQNQAQGYGQMLSQLALLAAYMKQNAAPVSLANPQTSLVDPDFGFLGPQRPMSPTPGYQSPQRPYHKPPVR